MEATLIISGGILLGCLLALSWFAGSDAPFVPTKMARIKKVLTLAGLKKSEIFYELGSGDGRVVIETAKMGAEAYGIEQSWLRIFWSRWKASQQNLPNARFIHGNIFSVIPSERSERGNLNLRKIARLAAKRATSSPAARPRNDVRNADIIFIFLLPKGVEKLESLLMKNLKKGSRIITQTFHFKNWKPYKKILITDENIPNTLLGKDKYEGDFWIYKV